MSIKLKNTLVSAMSAMSGPQLGSIHVLGSGGPFDVLEGTTSMLVTVDKKSLLIDCGPQIYSRMREQNVGMDISSIIITSSDESSIGSLATLVSHLFQNNGRVNIISTENIGRALRQYLFDVCLLPQEAVNFLNGSAGSGIHLYDTDPGTSAVVVEYDRFRIIHSGRINTPVFGVIDPEILERAEADVQNTLVFHDASLFTNGYGCHYESLSERSEVFKNFFIFNHNEEHGSKMIFDQRYMRSLSTNGGNNEFIIEKQFSI